jgi:hypothetical protein
MKIVLFTEDRNVVETLPNISNAKIYGLDEVIWDDGGMNFIEYRYVVIDDALDFADVTETEIFSQYKLQSNYSLAKLLESNKIHFLAKGTYNEKLSTLESHRVSLNGAVDEVDLEEKYHLATLELRDS